MQQIYALVHKDTDSAYGISFPDVLGCFSAADCNADIVVQAVEALTLWFEDAPNVTPLTLSQLHADPAIVAELDQGAVLMPIPFDPVRRAPC